MKQKKISKLLGLVGAAALSLGMFICPTAALPAQAATSNNEGVASPQSDCIEWRYFVYDGKLYKCLYNCSTREWVGEWVYIRDFPAKGKA